MKFLLKYNKYLYNSFSYFTDKSIKNMLLGHGKFGSVYKVETVNGLRAIKTCTRNEGYGFQPDILNEIDTLKKFRLCPYIIHPFGMSISGGQIKLEMEVMSNKLSAWLQEEDVEKRMKLLPIIMQQIGEALVCLHTSGFVHNDLKCNNILIDCSNYNEGLEEVTVKLIDFGKTGHYTQLNRYGAIDSYKIPSDNWNTNIFIDEILSFTICMTEVILGGRMFHESGSRSQFAKRYSCKGGYDIKEYLKEHIPRKEYRLIPSIYFQVFEPILLCKKNPTQVLIIMKEHFGTGSSYPTRITGSINFVSSNKEELESRILNIIPGLYNEAVFLKKSLNLCLALEYIHLQRTLTDKEIEASCYLFLHGDLRRKKPKFHQGNRDIKESQEQILESCASEIVYI